MCLLPWREEIECHDAEWERVRMVEQGEPLCGDPYIIFPMTWGEKECPSRFEAALRTLSCISDCRGWGDPSTPRFALRSG